MKHIFYILILAGSLMFTNCNDTGKEIDSPQPPPDTIEPKLLSMQFIAADNPEHLVLDAQCEIIGDTAVHCWIPNIMDSKMLIPRFEFNGDQVYINTHAVLSGVNFVDFKAPAKLIVKSQDKLKDYTVYVHAFTGLPILWIETQGREEVVSKDTYITASFTLTEDVQTRAPGDIVKAQGQIKGRGNSTWGAPKKPYRLKFDTPISFLDRPQNKSWVLLANYFDASKLRNATALYMSSISNLEYTPQFHFVEVMMNGRYNGSYQLGDQICIAPDRVNVGTDGFLLEIDSKAIFDDITLRVNHIDMPINIKAPSLQINDADYNYIHSYLSQADAALFSDNFTDPNEGWQKYLDINSFVDWYLINEITKNIDSNFTTSCFMHLKRGDKLKMGPVWDFDLSMGNVYNTEIAASEGFWTKNSHWYNRLFKDPAFTAKVKERFNYFYTHKNQIFDKINQDAQYLRYSIIENDLKWHTLYASTGPNSEIWGSHVNEVQFMKLWLTKRLEWLRTHL